jgi:hypothetical protein
MVALTVSCTPAFAQDSTEANERSSGAKDESSVHTNIAITPMASFAYPNFKFGDNYSSYWAGGLRACLNTDMVKGLAGYDIGLSWYYDQFKAREIDKIASLNSIGLNFDFYLFYIVAGMDWGASRFDASDEIYQHFGNNTGTEYGTNNGKWEFSFSRYYGLRVPIGPWFAVDAEFQLVSVETCYMFWHNMLSGTIYEIPVGVCDGFAEAAYKQDNIPMAIIMKLVGAGVSWAEYYFDYKNHDWPWHDPSPMRFPRGVIGVTFNIGNWPQAESQH